MSVYEKITEISLQDIEGFNAVRFSDFNETAPWAKDYIKAAKALGIISGKGDNRFDPKGTTTRAEAAKMMVEVLIKAGLLAE